MPSTFLRLLDLIADQEDDVDLWAQPNDYPDAKFMIGRLRLALLEIHQEVQLRAEAREAN